MLLISARGPTKINLINDFFQPAGSNSVPKGLIAELMNTGNFARRRVALS